MGTILNENGQPFTVQPGSFTRFNTQPNESHDTPGMTFYVKGNKLFKDPGLINPYATDAVLVERQGNLCFVKLGGNSWYSFTVRLDEEGREFFTSGRTHVIGINDVESRAYAEYISQVHAIKEAAATTAIKAEGLKDAERIRAEHESRRAEVKNKMLQVQKEIQALTPGMTTSDIMQDRQIQELLNEYVRLETLMKIRAL